MERLTRRSSNGVAVYAVPSPDAVKWKNNRYEVLQKLAEYEDLEEQGRLVKMPCKVGDTLYVITDTELFTVGAKNKYIMADGKLHIYVDSCCYAGFISYDDLGKTVFLTKSEAEEKLKELRGERNE